MEQPTKNHKLGWRLLLIVCSVALVASLIAMLAHFLPRRPAADRLVPQPTTTTTAADKPAPLPDNPIDFAALQAKNPDTVAYIQIPGTIIDYPIMSSAKGSDGKDFYINHNADGTAHRAGAIYIQRYLNAPDFSDPNTVVYGHNMANGSMFSWLHQYKKKAFFDEHRTILIYTPGHILTYKVYSAFLYDNRHILNSFNFQNEEDYAAFIAQTLKPSTMTKQVRDDVSVTTQSRILTLSTCAGSSSQRYLVVGVLIDDQPTK